MRAQCQTQLWSEDAFKALIRGHLIQICSFLKKKRQRLSFQELERDIKKMENRHALHSDLSALDKLSKLKLEYSSLLQKKVEYSLFRSKQKYYEQGKRTGRFLAQRAKQQYTQSLITGIQNYRGKLKTDDMDINPYLSLSIKVFINQMALFLKILVLFYPLCNVQHYHRMNKNKLELTLH